ncbi:MAG TPA: S1 family peptidase [Myxococcales bacterium]|nr:S1 family peptidase [Myxococcales bacterium]HIN84974.1 S1 family peptidase [Myxococcales bacterium]
MRIIIITLISLSWMGCVSKETALENFIGSKSTPHAFSSSPPSNGAPPPQSKVDDAALDQPFDICVDGPNKSYASENKVYYGTTQPTHVPLSEGQILAIGNFYGCSGALIAPTWVLSADHCGLSKWSTFCIGTDPSNADKCMPTKRVIDHPYADMSLVELKYDARDYLPQVEPIPLFTGTMDDSWKGRIVEAAGYGQQESGYSNKREFTAEPVAYFYDSMVTIDGEGQHGVCFGDSGGPLMVIAEDGTARVAGALSSGDSSCVGYDNYTRVDLYLDWIESYTGPTVQPGPQPCNGVTFVGGCEAENTRAKWCNAEQELEVQNCQAGTHCSWSQSNDGWRCVAPAQDACEGVDYAGACTDNTLSWCDLGGLKERDCAACGESCFSDNQGGFRCATSQCGDLTSIAVCDGDTLKSCQSNGQPQIIDCGQYGDTCDWVNHILGAWCVAEKKEVQCDGLGFYGYCDGDVVYWCNRKGQPDSKDCTDYGQSCEWTGTQDGFYCE